MVVKGFDPLASLFDAPDPSLSVPAFDSIEDSIEPTPTAPIEQLKGLDDSLEQEADHNEPEPEPEPESSSPTVELSEPMAPEDLETREIDKEELAAALAKAAVARSPQMDKIERLSARAARPRSAQDAMELERRSQAEREERRKKRLPRKVSQILARQLPGVENVVVENALIMDDRVVLKALWKAHRARMASHGSLDGVVGTTNVIRALDAVAQQQLAVAIVATESSEYLVWIDLGTQATIAAFADARSWISG
jgi:hypothetical protein